MEYTAYQYLWPTRPAKAVMVDTLNYWEQNREWVAQIKKNGTNNPVFVTDTEVIFKTRHNDDHKQWTPPQDIVDFFSQFPAWTVFNTELLHSKTKHIKDTIYIHDIVAYDGEQLVGSTFTERQALLQTIFDADAAEDSYSHYSITENVWLAKTFFKNFKTLYNSTLLFDEDEGLVLKNPDAKLKQCVSATSNSRWMIKCRKPHKNYSF